MATTMVVRFVRLLLACSCVANAIITNYPGQDCENAIGLNVVSGGSNYVTTVGGVDPFDFFSTYDVCDGNFFAGIWYEYVGEGKPVFLSTCGKETSYPTFISVFSSNNQGCGSDVLTCYNDRAGSSCRMNPNSSDVLIPTEVGVTYYIYVRPAGDPDDGLLPEEGGNFRLSLYEIELQNLNIPVSLNALNYQVANEVDDFVTDACVSGPPESGFPLAPDAQTTNDPTCQATGPCHLAFTQKNEMLRYFFTHDQVDAVASEGELVVDITVRAASLRSDRVLLLEVFSGTQQAGPFIRFNAPGQGYQEFRDLVWENVVLDPAEDFHQLSLTFESSNINVCSISIELSDVAEEDDDDDDDDDDGLPVIPFAINALSFNDAREIDQGIFGNCDIGPPPGGLDAPDAQDTMDEYCRQLGPCHIGFSQPNEYVVYDFRHSDLGDFDYFTEDGKFLYIYVDITIRVASIRGTNIVRMEISDGAELAGAQDFETPGLGYQEFRDVTWYGVELLPNEPVHSLLVGFVDGNINLCSISVVPSPPPDTGRPVPPITWSALEYIASSSPGVTVGRGDDPICINRDDTEDRVTLGLDGFLQYEVFMVESEGEYDITARGRSLNNGGTFRIEVVAFATGRSLGEVMFALPANRNDAVWDDYTYSDLFLEEGSYFVLLLVDDDGLMEFCSVSVLSSIDPVVLSTPGTYSALMYSDFVELSDERFGNCPDNRVVDTQRTNDGECRSAQSTFDFDCNVGWTEDGESLTYIFERPTNRGRADISIRVASNQRSRRIQLEVVETGDSFIIFGPGRGFRSYDTRAWSNADIGSGQTFTVKVTFLDGNVNLCSVGVSY